MVSFFSSKHLLSYNYSIILFPLHIADISSKALICLVHVHVLCNPSSYPTGLVQWFLHSWISISKSQIKFNIVTSRNNTTERGVHYLCFETLLWLPLTYRIKYECVPSNAVATVHTWLLNTRNVSGPNWAIHVKYIWILKTWYEKKNTNTSVIVFIMISSWNIIFWLYWINKTHC